MDFINISKNSIFLSDINVTIPFKMEKQSLSTDLVKKSLHFQSFCISNHFKIVGISSDRIEQNLYRIQNRIIPEHELYEPEIEVLMNGHFFNNTGYGKANRNLVYGLNKAGVRVCIKSESGDDTLNISELEKIYKFERLCKNKKYIQIDSYIPSFAHRKSDVYTILNTTVECSTIPQDFIDNINEYDEIWVPSYFCKQALSKYTDKHITVIPNSIDRIYNPKVKPLKLDKKTKDFVFLSVFSWDYRKGYDVLLKSYLKEFNKDDNVSLVIVTPYKYKKQDTVDEYISSLVNDNSPHIVRIGRFVPEFLMPSLYKIGNCFVLPSRGEGFGNIYCEASLCGLPIISTNYGGQLSFLNKNNSTLVDIDNLELLKEGTTNIHYWDNQLFPSLSSDNFIESFGKSMKYVYSNYQECLDKNTILMNYINNYCSLESVGRSGLERLRKIWNNL
jgi:glycosyltransferase involved in cell wall biosynthesis